MMVWELYSQYLLICIYYVLFTKMLHVVQTAGGTFLHKRFCRTCGENPRKIHLQSF